MPERMRFDFEDDLEKGIDYTVFLGVGETPSFEAVAAATRAKLSGILEDTARLAMLAYDMINGPAEDESIDNVYWRAFWVSSEKIAERHDDWSVMLLDRIARRADIDGGERMTMNELIEKQRKAAEGAKKKR